MRDDEALHWGGITKLALIHNLPSGGAKRHTFEQVRELDRRGHNVVEFALSCSELNYCSFTPYTRQQRVYDFVPAGPNQQHIPFVTPYLHAIQGIDTLRRLEYLNRRIATEIDEMGFDCALVKDCHFSMNPYVLRFLTTRSVFQCHHGLRHRLASNDGSAGAGRDGFASRLKSLYFRPAKAAFEKKFFADERRNARSASRVLTNSLFSREIMADYYKVDAHVVYPGINTDIFRPLKLDRLGYVLCVGALIYGKGYRFLVSALARIPVERRPVLFIAANSTDPNEEKAVRKLADELGVQLHVERIVDDARLVQVYSQARVFVYAPLHEALGMAPLEAMACGTPVVAVAEGGVKETVRDGQTGWCVQRDANEFSDKLDALLCDDQGRDSLGQAGIEDVRAKWTWARAVDQLELELGVARAK